MLKYGKKAATPDDRDVFLARYLELSKLPKIPTVFGHGQLIDAWGMLGNDKYGCCAWSGSAHETMLLNVLGGHPVSFTVDDVLADYAACTGFDPKTGANDNGTAVRDLMRYRRDVGIVDSTGKRHTIAAYIAVSHSDLAHVRAAAFLFDVLPLGFMVPETAEQQFNDGVPWTVVGTDVPIVGGHYVPGTDVVVRPEGIEVVTWGKRQLMTWPFFEQYVDEVWAVLSTEALQRRLSPEGFNLAQLRADLAAVRG